MLFLLDCALSLPALADSVPDAVSASSGVYKVIAENDALRVIEATWQPGQRDVMHAHPAIGVYFLSDCENMRTHLTDGTPTDWSASKGDALANDVVASHSIENAGDAVCRLVFVESK